MSSSSSVSNSLASCANSSSASGSCRALTAVTVTVTSASRSLYSPATSVVGNVADSPADRPVIASSMPSISPPWPTWYDSPVVWASSTAWPSTLAARSICTKSSFAAARSTPVRVA